MPHPENKGKGKKMNPNKTRPLNDVGVGNFGDQFKLGKPADTGKPTSAPGQMPQNRGQVRSAQVHARNAARKLARRNRLTALKAGRGQGS